MSQWHVLVDREVGGHRDDAEQLVRQHGLLSRRRGTGEHVQPFVDLQRIAVHRHRFFTARAQQLRKLHAHAGLAYARGSEYGQNSQGWLGEAPNGLYFLNEKVE